MIGVGKRMSRLELQEDDIEKVVLKYSNMIFKICLVLLCNEHDAKDAVQDTFYKYIRNLSYRLGFIFYG